MEIGETGQNGEPVVSLAEEDYSIGLGNATILHQEMVVPIALENQVRLTVNFAIHVYVHVRI